MLFIGTIREWWVNRSRNIFRFRDGSKWRYCDPVVIGTKIEEVDPKYQELLSLLAKKPTSDMPLVMQPDLVTTQREAIQKLATISRQVFDLPVLTPDGSGFTDGEAVGIIGQYFAFMENLARASLLFRDSQRME